MNSAGQTVCSWCALPQGHKRWCLLKPPQPPPEPPRASDHVADVAAHFSAGKPGLQWLPWGPLTEVAKVLDYGAQKYGSRHNWKKGMNWMELAGSTCRHVTSWIRGDDFDAESGLHHLAHAVCDLLFLLEYHLQGSGTDDRK